MRKSKRAHLYFEKCNVEQESDPSLSPSQSRLSFREAKVKGTTVPPRVSRLKQKQNLPTFESKTFSVLLWCCCKEV